MYFPLKAIIATVISVGSFRIKKKQFLQGSEIMNLPEVLGVGICLGSKLKSFRWFANEMEGMKTLLVNWTNFT